MGEIVEYLTYFLSKVGKVLKALSSWCTKLILWIRDTTRISTSHTSINLSIKIHLNKNAGRFSVVEIFDIRIDALADQSVHLRGWRNMKTWPSSSNTSTSCSKWTFCTTKDCSFRCVKNISCRWPAAGASSPNACATCPPIWDQPPSDCPKSSSSSSTSESPLT